MKSPISLVSFDLDDTLWDNGNVLKEAEAAQWSFLDKKFPSINIKDISTGELTTQRENLLLEKPHLTNRISEFREQFILSILIKRGVKYQNAKWAASEAFERFLEQRHRIILDAQAIPMLTTLRQYFLVGAITNGNADVYKTELGRFFDFAWRAEQFGVSKPDPKLFHKAFAQAGVTADQVIHIGDSHEHDVDGAIKAGARAIWLNHDGKNSPLALATVNSLNQVTQVLLGLHDYGSL